MKLLILGGDGYLGWPTAMHFANLGYEVMVVDDYSRRNAAKELDRLPLFDVPKLDVRCEKFKSVFGHEIKFKVCNLAEAEYVFEIFRIFQPDAIIHYAEQPSAPYSMMGFQQAQFTLNNNISTTFNVLWAMLEYTPNAHLIKLGTMGEYGTPNIDIPEGWIEIDHNSRKDTFLFPRAASSLYHTTKVLDTDLIWFYVRTHNLRVTDLMQGPVYGIQTLETQHNDELLPSFSYDDVFGTVVNRFLVQAIAGIPLTVFGEGGQTRGYLNLIDTLQCIELATKNPAGAGELRILNQFTETFSVNELAERIRSAAKILGHDVKIQKLPNPRLEKEEHYYNPAHTGLTDLGLEPNFMTQDVIIQMLEKIKQYKSEINKDLILPKVSWK